MGGGEKGQKKGDGTKKKVLIKWEGKKCEAVNERRKTENKKG